MDKALEKPPNITDATERACKEPTLLDALAWICIWESERVVKQARTNLQWETCFKVCLQSVLDSYRKLPEGEPPLLSDEEIVKASNKLDDFIRRTLMKTEQLNKLIASAELRNPKQFNASRERYLAEISYMAGCEAVCKQSVLDSYRKLPEGEPPLLSLEERNMVYSRANDKFEKDLWGDTLQFHCLAEYIAAEVAQAQRDSDIKWIKNL